MVFGFGEGERGRGREAKQREKTGGEVQDGLKASFSQCAHTQEKR